MKQRQQQINKTLPRHSLRNYNKEVAQEQSREVLTKLSKKNIKTQQLEISVQQKSKKVSKKKKIQKLKNKASPFSKKTCQDKKNRSQRLLHKQVFRYILHVMDQFYINDLLSHRQNIVKLYEIWAKQKGKTTQIVDNASNCNIFNIYFLKFVRKQMFNQMIQRFNSFLQRQFWIDKYQKNKKQGLQKQFKSKTQKYIYLFSRAQNTNINEQIIKNTAYWGQKQKSQWQDFCNNRNFLLQQQEIVEQIFGGGPTLNQSNSTVLQQKPQNFAEQVQIIRIFGEGSQSINEMDYVQKHQTNQEDFDFNNTNLHFHIINDNENIYLRKEVNIQIQFQQNQTKDLIKFIDNPKDYQQIYSFQSLSLDLRSSYNLDLNQYNLHDFGLKPNIDLEISE